MNDLEKPTSTNPLVLLQSAIDRGMDPEKLGKLMDLAERWQSSQAAAAYGQAVKQFQSLCPPIVKGNPVYGKNKDLGPQYFFADFDDIMAVVQPILDQCNIAIRFDTKIVGAAMETTCHVRVGTHVEGTSVTLALPAIPNANDTQRAGAALSYGKRYSLCAALNIRVKGEDTDAGNMANYVDTGQAETLNDLFEKCRDVGKEVDMARFWAWVGCTSMHDMLSKDFDRAVDLLKRKAAGK